MATQFGSATASARTSGTATAIPATPTLAAIDHSASPTRARKGLTRGAALLTTLAAGVSLLATPSESDAAFLYYSVVATNVTNSGQNLTRYEVFANFNGPTDTVLNVFNFQAQGGWAGHADAANGFWHKDYSYSSPISPGTLSQEYGGWSPQLIGSATANRPFDSFLLIGGNPSGTNTTTGDPGWNCSGGGYDWIRVDFPLCNDLGWFNASPPNLQGRVGIAPNTATKVKIGQFILSQNDTAFRTYTLRIAVNNADNATPVYSDGSFILCPGFTYYRDLDGDGFGSAAGGTITQCGQPAGYVLSNTDCNDADATINPTTIWYRDLDGDGLGAAVNGTLTQCTQPDGYVRTNTDNCPSIANPEQTDCNANGIGDVCELAAGTAFDCDNSGTLDTCEFSSDALADCDSDGRSDICEGAVIIAASSPLLAPFGNGFPATYTFSNLPKAYRGTPTLTLEATSDLSSSNEFIAVAIDGRAQEYFFTADGTDCPASPDIATRTFTIPALNALVADGTLTVSLLASGTVDAAQCAGGGVRLRLNYDGLPASSDCNANGLLDSCEIGTGAAADCNGNGIPDACDISGGTSSDCNSNGALDSCDIASGTSTDLNANAIPDECSNEFIVGGSGYPSIAAALAAAPSGTTVRVAAGTYATNALVSAKQIHLRSLSGAASTILSGAGANGAILAFDSAATNGSTLDGFTFRDGVIGHDFAGFRVGGALACIDSSISIVNCVFTANRADYGGAIYAIRSSTAISNSTFTLNSSSVDGGAVTFGDGDNWSVSNCTFTGNASGNGGALHAWVTGGTITDCLFTQNTASGLGGAFSYYAVNAHGITLDGCTIEANSALDGGGIYEWFSQSEPTGALELLDTRLCRNEPQNIVGPFNDLGGNTQSGDCNDNGVCDADEIAAGAETDCNSNGVPDSCELLGEVIGWGEDDFGQATPPPQLGDVVQISAGCSHNLALASDGTVRSWGMNSFGQLDIPPGLTNAVQVSAGCSHNVALRADGLVFAWGSDAFGKSTPPALSGVTQVCAGDGHSAARKSDGTVVLWGRNASGESTPPAGLGASVEIVLGGAHSIARHANGTITCWGLNNFGQCNVPANVGVLSSVVAGCYHTAGLRTNGTVVCWGSNLFNQCAVPAGLANVVQLAAGIGQHTLALKSDGSLAAWGWNAFGQTNIPDDLGPVSLLAAGGTHTMARSASAPDCNSNGIIDSCDIADGFADCDGDGVLDACEIAAQPSLDCNGNGALDSCELAGGAADCNSNGLPDSCDITSGTSSDLDGNSVPDDCSTEFIVGGTGYATIQAAIDAAPGGATVLVGVKYHNSPILITGKSVTMRPIYGALSTTLSGTDLSSSIMVVSGAAASHTVIEGFIFTEGVVGTTTAGTQLGGALFLHDCAATVRDCRFAFNSAIDGGAIGCASFSGVIEACEFSGNSASARGGAILLGYGGNWVLRNNAFLENMSGSQGGALTVIVQGANGGGLIESCNFAYNGSAFGNALAYRAVSGTNLRVTDCVVEHNSGPADAAFARTLDSADFAFEMQDSRFCLNGTANVFGPIVDLGGNLFSQDCNGNGECDADEISAGSALDCNSNGFPDDCDLSSGFSSDCNDNTIPDSCDIAAGTSTDVDGNGIPDDCKPDCDNDGLPDAWELLQGLDSDCDGNSMIDRCEIAKAPALDCNGNMQLDSCEALANPSLDCDGNGAIDYCEIANTPALDCNADGTLDTCQIDSGALPDCDANGRPDACDITDGAEDENSNGHLDTCELARGDLNLDGVVSGGDLAVLLSFWGSVNPPAGDLTGDGLINGSDLAVILSNWGSTP